MDLTPLQGWVDIVHKETTKSTNDDALDWVQSKGLQERPVLFVCDNQTHGRGRHGRNWGHGGKENSIAFSLLVPIDRFPPLGLSLVAGTSVINALDIAKIKLKWPNDLIDKTGHKYGGILIEIRNKPKCAAIGIGLNLAIDATIMKYANGTPIGAITEESSSIDRWEIVTKIVKKLVVANEKFQIKGFEEFRSQWLQNSIHQIGDKILISDEQGRKRNVIFQDIDIEGCLICQDEQQRIKVASGEVN